MKSYWLDTTPLPEYPAADGNASAEVIVIGGGIAGICCAWEIARTGRKVALLEARRILTGVTGNTTAKLTSLHGLVYQQLGAEARVHYAAAQEDAISRVREIVGELGIDCDLETRSAFTYSADTARIEAEVRAAQAAGLHATLVHETGLPYPVGAAIRVDGQAQFDPVRFLWALAQDLERLGGRIYEDSRVSKVEGREVTLESGPVLRAHAVVVATQFPIAGKLSLVTRLVPKRELVVAGPIPERLDPQGMYLTPDENLRSVRTAPYGPGTRLLIVTGETYRPGEPGVAKRFDRLAEWAIGRFPGMMPRYQWAAQDESTTDRVPFIGRYPGMGENVFVCAGFGGWGMSNGVAAGRMIAAALQEQPLPWSAGFDPGRVDVLAEAGRFLGNGVKIAGHLIGDRLGTGKIEDLEPGDGRVVKVDGKPVAAYRDAAGELHAVSAKCTHQGCLVGFNDAEHTWDCPCHGSRFGLDGSVITGPAVSPLEKSEVDSPSEAR